MHGLATSLLSGVLLAGASGRQALDERIHNSLHEQIARPPLRTVVLSETDAADGRPRWTVLPDRSGSADYAGDPAVPVAPDGPG